MKMDAAICILSKLDNFACFDRGYACAMTVHTHAKYFYDTFNLKLYSYILHLHEEV